MNIDIKGHKFLLRKCEDTDYDFVFELLKENMYDAFIRHWGSWNSQSFEDGFDKNKIMIIEYEGKRVAFFDLKCGRDAAYINNVQVSTKLRGKGLGTFLIGLMEKMAKEHNLTRIRLKVFNDNVAKGLYERLGYKPVKDDGASSILEKAL